MDALDDVYPETYELPELCLWDGTDQIAIGCTYGGTVELSSRAADGPIRYAYDKCGVFSNNPLTGTGTFDPSDGTFRYEGFVGSDNLTFQEDSDGNRVADDTWPGRTVHDRDR